MAKGRVVRTVGDDISTDIIYPGRFMATVLPTETPLHAFADDAEFNHRLKTKEIPPGSILVAGRNFGCGSSREQAASCLKGYDLVVVARNFARIFLQNAINLGLYMVICPTVEAKEGDELEVREGALSNLTTGKSYPIVPLPRARQAIIDAGGLIPYTRQLLAQRSHGDETFCIPIVSERHGRGSVCFFDDPFGDEAPFERAGGYSVSFDDGETKGGPLSSEDLSRGLDEWLAKNGWRRLEASDAMVKQPCVGEGWGV